MINQARTIIFLFLLFALPLTGCGGQDIGTSSGQNDTLQGIEECAPEENSVVSSEKANQSKENQEMTAQSEVSFPTQSERREKVNELRGLIDHQKQVEELTVGMVDGEENAFKGFWARRYSPFYGYNPTLDMVDSRYPVECLRDMENGRNYAVYSAKGGGLYYIFFRDDINPDLSTLSHGVYVSNPKSKKDFDSIQVGDTFERVVAVDPDAQKWVECPYSVHLLEDGILQYTYQDGIVTDIDYSPDFVYKETFDTGTEELVVEYDYSILPQDYPS